MTAEILDDVHEYWFGSMSEFAEFPDAKFPIWFTQSDETDRTIRERFGAAVAAAPAAHWDPTALSPTQQAGLIVLLDQFPRNLHRGSAQAYAYDALARQLAGTIIAAGLDGLKLIERVFVILPFGHSESLADQDRALEAFGRHVTPFAPEGHFFFEGGRRQAQRYRDIIARFGHFPHRNGALGRETTPEEAAFIKETNMAPF